MPAPIYEPTPEQIRKVCEEIQATWSDDDRRARVGCRKPVAYILKPHRIRGTGDAAVRELVQHTLHYKNRFRLSRPPVHARRSRICVQSAQFSLNMRS